MKEFILFLIYLICAPFIGGLLAGIDRVISARMQSRVGPPVLQPFYDVGKLLQKENLVVRRSQNYYIWFFLLFVIFTGALFFTGGDLLLVIFALTLAGIFFVLAGYKASSPYSFVGAERELLLMTAYEPMVIVTAIGMYMVTKSFAVADIVKYPHVMVWEIPAIFAGFVYILAIKFRKSPFDLSTSHHAHQELVKGLTTEFSGRTLAMIEIAHWYENVFLLGIVYLFFAANIVFAVLGTAATFFFMVLVDNCFARLKWKVVLESTWAMAFILGLGNLMFLFFLKR
jgi:formate hydrogenlyase subunit 4